MSNFIHKDVWCLCFCYFPRNKQIKDEAHCGKLVSNTPDYLMYSPVIQFLNPFFFLED